MELYLSRLGENRSIMVKSGLVPVVGWLLIVLNNNIAPMR